jgi:hypothetical protein
MVGIATFVKIRGWLQTQNFKTLLDGLVKAVELTIVCKR